MADPLITLTTDFGEDSPYVAVLKGVLLSINPRARLLDLGHLIPPQDVRYAAFFLAAAVPHFPKNTLHVVVVDPGVGSDRALLYVETQGQRLLVPDNGCWTAVVRPDETPCVIRLDEPRYWRQPVSATFHGRDILAPAAGHLSRGVDPSSLGPRIKEWVRFETPMPQPRPHGIAGLVIFVDHFGNLLTNVPGEAVAERPTQLTVGNRRFRRGFRWIRTYAEAPPGSLVGLVSSNGMVEVAVVEGNAAERFRARAGTPIALAWKSS